MEWLILLLALAALGVFLWSEGHRPRSPTTIAHKSSPVEAFRVCPLCNHLLHKGETVHSYVFHKGKDSLMEIVGCPYCRPDSPKNDGSPRRCPVCRRSLDPDETVPARIFRRPNKMHVHVLGCRVCRRRNIT